MKTIFGSGKRPLFAGIFVFIAVLVLTQGLAFQRYLILHTNEEQELTHHANWTKERLQTVFSYSFSTTRTLAFIVNQYGVPANFDSVANELLKLNPYVDAVQLVQGGVITNVYPLAGNEPAVGIDILKDTMRRTGALEAIKTRDFFVAGPIHLIQGGEGFVARLPIFKEGEFWGFSAVIIKLQSLLKAAHIDTASQGQYAYQLSYVNPETGKEEFFLQQTTILDKSHFVPVEFSNGEWKLYIIPQKSNTVFAVSILSALGFLLSLIGGLFTWFIVSQPVKLTRLVEEKTEQIQRVQNQITIEKELSESIVNSMPGVFYLFDDTGKYIRWNKNQEDITGYSTQEMKDLHPSDLVPEQDRARLAEKMKEVFEYGKSEVELNFVSKDGTTSPYYFNGSSIIYENKRCLIGVGIDITERKNAEAALIKSHEDIRRLNTYLQTIREEERTTISREIHDELGQLLTGIKMDVSWMAKKFASTDEGLTSKTNEVLTLIDETVKTVRRISTNLRPGVLDDLGLIAALEWQSAEFEKRTGIPCIFHTDLTVVNIARDTATGIFRLYQESLTNIMRHAKATEAKAVLKEEGGFLILTIRDNGKGFDIQQVQSKKTLGLIGMKERALMIGGDLSIVSAAGQGTTINLRVPYPIHT